MVVCKAVFLQASDLGMMEILTQLCMPSQHLLLRSKQQTACLLHRVPAGDGWWHATLCMGPVFGREAVAAAVKSPEDHHLRSAFPVCRAGGSSGSTHAFRIARRSRQGASLRFQQENMIASENGLAGASWIGQQGHGKCWTAQYTCWQLRSGLQELQLHVPLLPVPMCVCRCMSWTVSK